MMLEKRIYTALLLVGALEKLNFFVLSTFFQELLGLISYK